MSDDDVKVRIRKLLDEAMVKYGPSIELAAIEASWGDTLNDEEMIDWLETFLAHGTGLERDVETDDLQELEEEYQKGLTRH
ncbi:hypothetical protein [Devosia nitrariae]|uniref:Uncharacterized protein n=1 Tax=Devosia nitrariae TaxID=2071872 RepID=A0ABQ5W135_9HYPH|nr:hypothetical protein [Devosia nitrariae]GLQ53625.1 hypothetical protein GCM10010862_08840 [Devosia nitrariae]